MSIIVCSMSVIIPAILRAMGVGDPFMQEDTVDPGVSTGVDIALGSTTRIELGLPMPRGAAITNSDESEGAPGLMVPRQRDFVDFNVKDGKKYQLTTQASDGSLGNSMTGKALPLVDDRNVGDSLARPGSSPAVATDRNIEVDTEEKRVTRNST